VEGLNQRPADKKTTLIHMSGTGNFVDKRWTDGAHHEETKVWDDANPEDMALINPSMLNGGPDTVVLNAGKAGKIGTYIVFPSGIYGQAAGPVPALGVIQLVFEEKAKELGFVPYIGEGSAIFNCLHVDAIAPFVLKVLDLALKPDEPQGTVYERCYLISGQEISWKEASEAFAKDLHAAGVISNPEAKSVTKAEAGEGELPMLMASDMRFKMTRATALGYTHNYPSLVEYLRRSRN
jgi:nucleoside-diphosphate-sugar epimerase